MKQKAISRVLAAILCVCLCLSILPMSTFAYVADFVSETHDVFSRTSSTIAPGVTQDVVYAYAKDGKQMVYYVATADITRDDVVVQTSYKEQYVNKQFGMSKLTDQMAYADTLYTDETSDRYISEYYKAVAGVNASFYNMTTGQPSGVTYLDGVQIGESSSYNQFFAILKDGTAIVDYTSNLSKYSGNIWQAAAGSQMLVFDGKDVTKTISGDYNTDRHSRTCVGVTADGKVVLMSLDGRQEPFSCGGTMHELAQIMLEAGCVAAINLDGGGSTTFAARQEGEDEVTIVNRPSDGSERSISSGLIIGSLAAPSNVFERATLDAENDYVTPGSAVTVTAKGVSPAGTAADIPENAAWQLKDASMGTVEDGVFTSNGTVGTAVVQMTVDGTVVGETSINVVVPEKIAFNSDMITVPYGKTVTLSMTATVNEGMNTVVLKEGDIQFSLSNEALGTIKGWNFTACEENAKITSGTVTAALAFDNSLTCAATINLGKGSEVVYDFEEESDISRFTFKTGYPQYGPKGSAKDENGNYYYNGQNEVGTMAIVTSENGKVHNGNKSLALTCDYTQIYETGYHQLSLGGLNFKIDASAQAFGVWVYLPELEDITALKARFIGATTGSAENNVAAYFIDEGGALTLEHNGWYYFSTDLSAFGECTISALQIYVSDRDQAANNYYFADHSSVNSKFTLYLDDITIDYSSAVDDREAPVFDYVRASYGGLSDAVDVKGQTINSNVVSVTAKVGDDTTKTNYTGIDVNTAKAYIDGVELKSGFSCTDAGIITIDDVTLADGTHTFKFEICDNMGNVSWIERQLTVAADSDMTTVSVVPADADADKLLIGSLYWMNIETSAIENIQSITTELNLNSVSSWELDNMNVATGFEATYTIDEVTNNATITITRTGENTETGKAVLAELPIRTWVSRLTEYEGYEASTPASLWTRKIIWPMDIKLEANVGSITFEDGTTGTFSMSPVAVDTELYGNYAELNANGDYSNKSSWHVHTAEAVEDKAATCTEDGYTGRTFCNVCNSVVDWGTIVPATGHTYVVVDGALRCEGCDETLNGEYTDGKTYVDGVVAEGWVEDFYYVDGVKLTGIQFIDDLYYNFGDDGVSQGRYTGFLEKEEGWYYIIMGSVAKGWQYIDGEYYYFDPDTGLSYYGQDYYIYNQSYKFTEKGKLISGLWVENAQGTRYFYGPNYYYRTWMEIDGNTYYFDVNGYRKEGTCCFVAGINGDTCWYEFTDDGVLVKAITDTGLFEFDGQLYYLENGACQHGLFEVDGDYYYFNSSLTAVSGKYWISNTNGIEGFAAGYYEFDETTHKMIIEKEEVKNGLILESDGLHYYVDGVQQYAGLVQDENGDYYYINSTLKAVSGRYWVEKNNGLLDKGYYEFDSTTYKMIRDEVKNGLMLEDGKLYYYVDGAKQYGLYEVDGDYYYFNSSLAAVSGKYWVSNTNGIEGFAAGYYEFDETTHKMIREEAKNGLILESDGLHYYVDGVQQYAGLVQDENGDYYYINGTLKAVSGRYWVEKNNGLLNKGFYEFDTTTYKMIRG